MLSYKRQKSFILDVTLLIVMNMIFIVAVVAGIKSSKKSGHSHDMNSGSESTIVQNHTIQDKPMVLTGLKH